MQARMESVHRTGQVRLDLRLIGGLAAALAIGVTAGYLTATLNAPSASKVVSHAPAAATAPSTGVYGDRDSRLPYQSTSGAWGDHDSRLPVATGAGISVGEVWGDRDSSLPVVSASDATGIASVDHDSRPPLAPFSGH
jgi:hypothetical protein